MTFSSKIKKEISTNPMINTINVFYCNKLIEEKNFKKAYQEMDKLLDGDYNIIEIYQYLMTLECIYCELVDNKKDKYLVKYQDKTMQNHHIRTKHHIVPSMKSSRCFLMSIVLYPEC